MSRDYFFDLFEDIHDKLFTDACLDYHQGIEIGSKAYPRIKGCYHYDDLAGEWSQWAGYLEHDKSGNPFAYTVWFTAKWLYGGSALRLEMKWVRAKNFSRPELSYTESVIHDLIQDNPVKIFLEAFISKYRYGTLEWKKAVKEITTHFNFRFG